MTTQPHVPPNAGSPRWMKVALLVSLALNLLIIGAVSAALWRLRHDGPRALAAAGPGGHLMGFTATLPAERRRAIWLLTAEQRRALRGQRAEVRSARQALQDQLRADTFDAAKFAQAQASLLAAESKARAEAQKMFLTIISQMSKEERAAYAKWEASPPTDGRGRGRIWRDPPADSGADGRPARPGDSAK